MIKEKFENLFSFGKKSTLKAAEGLEEGLYPFFTSSSVQKKRSNTAQYHEESLVIGNGGAANLHYVNEPFSVSSHCIVVNKKSPNVSLKFIYYYLAGNVHILEQGFKGAGLQNISQKYIQNIEIPIYDIEIQNKIVAILDKASALVQKRQKAIKLLDELLNAQFLEMFGDPITNKRKWKMSLLEEIATLERGRFSPRPRNDPSYFNGVYPFIQTGDISKANYRLTEYSQTLNEKGISVSKKFQSGVIVIAIVGATIGATAILLRDVYATDSIIGINSKKGKSNNVFLEMILRFYRQVLIDKAPEAARANINLGILNKLEIIQPPFEQQDKFRTISSAIEEKQKKLIKNKFDIETLFSSILRDAFTGKLTLNVAVEIDALLKEINLHTENDLINIVTNEEYLLSLVSRLNKQEFENQDLYDRAKHVAFQLLKQEERLTQEYDKKSKTLKLVLK